MRAAVLRGGTVEARVIDDPVPGPGQLLVRSLACGICASDLHFMDHPEAGADDDSGMSTYEQDVDIVMGHEYCAEVVGHAVFVAQVGLVIDAVRLAGALGIDERGSRPRDHRHGPVVGRGREAGAPG